MFEDIINPKNLAPEWVIKERKSNSSPELNPECKKCRFECGEHCDIWQNSTEVIRATEKGYVWKDKNKDV